MKVLVTFHSQDSVEETLRVAVANTVGGPHHAPTEAACGSLAEFVRAMWSLYPEKAITIVFDTEFGYIEVFRTPSNKFVATT